MLNFQRGFMTILMFVSYTSSDNMATGVASGHWRDDMAWTQQDRCYVNDGQRTLARQCRIAAPEKDQFTALAKAASSAPYSHPSWRHMQMNKEEEQF